MQIPTLPIQDEILSTLHAEKNISKIHDKLFGLVDEYGWQYPHYLMSIDFQVDKRNKFYLLDVLEFLQSNPNLLQLSKQNNDHFLLLEEKEYIQVLAQQNDYFIASPTTTHLLPMFLETYSKHTHEFDISHIDWQIKDKLGFTPFFYAMQFESQYFVVDYVKKEIPFFDEINEEQIPIYENMLDEKELPNKPLIQTLFEKYKLEAIINSNYHSSKKLKI